MSIPCKRCLLRDMDGQDYSARVEEYRQSLAADNLADDALYEARLAACKGCDDLSGGVCMQCGCFVEMRAAALGQDCPARKWAGL